MIRTHGVSTSIVGVACRFTKHHWTRVRMSLLIPLALGACALSRSEERRVGKRVDLGGRRHSKKKNQ